MISRIELENQLVNEIHYLPVDAIEKMLKWVRSLKKVIPVEQIAQPDHFADFIRNSPLMGADVEFERDESISAGAALKNFLKKYENNPIDIDTSIFDDYRKTVTERFNAPQKPILLKRQAGLGRGTILMSDDFDDELPDSFWLGEDE